MIAHKSTEASFPPTIRQNPLDPLLPPCYVRSLQIDSVDLGHPSQRGLRFPPLRKGTTSLLYEANR